MAEWWLEIQKRDIINKLGLLPLTLFLPVFVGNVVLIERRWNQHVLSVV